MKILISILFVIWSSGAFACKGPEYVWANTLNSEKHHVQGPYTIDQLEKAHMIEIRESKKVLPFGYINEEWENLKSMYKPGDLFFFVRYDDGRFFM